jgi:hypothetical protein
VRDRRNRIRFRSADSWDIVIISIVCAIVVVTDSGRKYWICCARWHVSHGVADGSCTSGSDAAG